MSKILLTISSLVIGAGVALLTLHQTPHGATATITPKTGKAQAATPQTSAPGQDSSGAAASAPASDSQPGQHHGSSLGPTQPAFAGAANPQPSPSALQESEAYWATLPIIPAGWHWIYFDPTAGTINRVWVPVPDTWYNKPQYNRSGPVNNLVVWGNHVITSQGARFGYGVTISEYGGTPSQLAHGPLGHNGDLANPATPFDPRPAIAGHTVLISTQNYDPVSGNTGPTVLIQNGAQSIDITVRVPAAQTAVSTTIIHDMRFGFR